MKLNDFDEIRGNGWRKCFGHWNSLSVLFRFGNYVGGDLDEDEDEPGSDEGSEEEDEEEAEGPRLERSRSQVRFE